MPYQFRVRVETQALRESWLGCIFVLSKRPSQNVLPGFLARSVTYYVRSGPEQSSVCWLSLKRKFAFTEKKSVDLWRFADRALKIPFGRSPMSNYTAPLRDMRFVVEDVLDFDGHFATIDPSGETNVELKVDKNKIK